MPYLKGKAKKDKKKGPVNRFVLLMNNSRREEKESTMEKQATGISLLKTTIKDGATRAKRLRAELLEDPTSTAAGTIQWRQFSTRQSVRHLNLAYGFLRGTSYAEMERTSREEPNWKVVKKLVEEYGVRVNHLLPRYDARKTLAKGQEEQESRWESWLEEAKVHFEDNRIK
jgi:exonuclease I